MSSIRQTEKRQIRVPSKLADSDYGVKNGKNKRNKKKNNVNVEDMSNDGLEEKVDAIGEEVDECQTGENSEPVVAASGVNESIKESEGSGMKGKENVMDKSEIRQEGKTKEARRVLIDVEAEKGLPDRIDIIYKNRDGLVTAKKSVDVNYDWSPPPLVCTFCKVFGHCDKNWVVRPKTVVEFMKMEREEEKKKQNKGEFEQVRYKRKDRKKVNQNGVNKIDRKGTNSNTVFYKPVVKKSTNVGEEIRNEVEQEKMIDKGSPETEENECESLVEEGIEKEKEIIDVYDETSRSAKKIAQNDIRSSYVEVLNGIDRGRLGKVRKQNVVKELIVDENVSICAILETRLKGDKVKKIGERLFGRWNCVVFVHASDQAVLCVFEIQSSKKRLFCTFVHAEISGKLSKKLWNDLNIYKATINDGPWVIMGDLNVSLNLDDHSEGISFMTQHMEEFKKCINDIKMEDICISGPHYAWIKSLLNPNTSVLKKIDKVTGNEEFLEEYFRAHAVFLPYGISDHSQAVLTCPQSIKAKSRSFRFSNYIADKDDFLDVIKDKLKNDVEGYAMFKLAKKLKSLKPAMNKLNWKNRNLYELEHGVGLFKEYTLALEDEEKLMLQKSTVEWLKERDRNSAYFHKGGYTTKFFKQSLNVIGEDVCNAVNEFLSKGKTFEGVKCNHDHFGSKGPKRCSMKIDIQKAYDTVNWKFLENALRLFGFHTKMVHWIMTCVATPSYTICLNGERHGYFKGGRGLRQGDPLSPYLFTLVMEVFNLILHQEIIRNGRFKYHYGYKELEINHLCFADDLLVLCHGDINSVQVIKNALEKFSVVSGLYPNLGKSTILCGRMDRGTIDSILQILPFKRGKFPWRFVEGKSQSCLEGGMSVLEEESQQKDSWIWKSLLDLRSNVRENMIYKIGNGKKASIWHDRWSDKPSIDTIVSRRDIYTAGFNNNDTVFSCIKGNQ
ncbi:RNA-directed DNA polymerase, eukaryota, reverse transcriptase zinc-binding domain protein [Tanacetum coccineum]